MLMSDFARATGLAPDTVRFYVRRGLLWPATGAKGGRNPYQVFGDDDVRAAAMIRLGQALGLSLKEIAALFADHRAGRIDRDGLATIMSGQRDRLRAKAAELSRLADYLDAKLAWMASGEEGLEPSLADRAEGCHSLMAVAYTGGTTSTTAIRAPGHASGSTDVPRSARKVSV